MIYLKSVKTKFETIKTKLTVAVLLKDDLSPEKKAVGYIFLKAANIKRLNKPIAVIRNSSGFFLLMDLPEGEYTLIAGGKFYKKKEYLTFNTKSVSPKQPICLDLEPKANYPFPEGTTVLKGKIVDAEKNPVPDADIKVKAMNAGAASDVDGSFFIIFKDIDVDKKIVINIGKNGYKSEESKVPLKKGFVKSIETKLIKK